MLNVRTSFPSDRIASKEVVGLTSIRKSLPCTGSSMVRQLTGNHIDKSIASNRVKVSFFP